MSAAASVLTNGSFDSFSIRKVASHAGVSVGAIYEYFPSKQALLFWVVEARLKTRLASLDAVFAGQNLESKSLHQVIDESIHALRMADLYSKLDLEIRAAEDGDPKLAEYTAQYKQELTKRYVDLWHHYGSSATDDYLEFIAEYAHRLDTLSMKLQLNSPDREREVRDINQQFIHLLADLAMQSPPSN